MYPTKLDENGVHLEVNIDHNYIISKTSKSMTVNFTGTEKYTRWELHKI